MKLCVNATKNRRFIKNINMVMEEFAALVCVNIKINLLREETHITLNESRQDK